MANNVCEPFAECVVSQEKLADADVLEPAIAPSKYHSTFVIPTLSDEATFTLTTPVTVVPLLGEVIWTVGAVVSRTRF